MEYLENFRTIIMEELRRRNWTKRDLAQRIDMDATLINSMLRGKRRFNEDQVIAIAEGLEMEPYRLFTDREMISRQQAREMLKKAVEFEGSYELVEEIEAIACGNLSSISDRSILGYKVFEKNFLKGMYKPFLTRASGDSMFPTLAEGDLILFNRDPDKLQAPNPNKIYLVNLAPGEEDTGLTIKRVGLSKEEWTLTIVPDNRMYPIEIYGMSQKKSVLEYVLAVAAWVGKEL